MVLAQSDSQVGKTESWLSPYTIHKNQFQMYCRWKINQWKILEENMIKHLFYLEVGEFYLKKLSRKNWQIVLH